MKIFLENYFNFSLSNAGLRDRANRVYIGVAISHWFLNSTQYQNIGATEYNSVTAEWQMKNDPIWNNPNTPFFQYAEEIMSFAAQHNQKVRGHALIWHEATPTWMEALESNPAELQRVMEQQI